MIISVCIVGVYSQSCPEQCVCRFSKITCSGETSSLTKFPEIESENWIRVIEVVNTNITSLQEGNVILPTVPRLIQLSLYSNGIKTLNNSMFVNNTLIEKLSLHNNILQFIPSNSFKPLKNLVYIDLGRNEIQVIESNAFMENKNLEFISLKLNAIRDVHPLTFNGLINLTTLDLSFNNISEFPIGRLQHHLSNLRYLTIGNNFLLDIQTTDQGLESCQQLVLESNLITTLQNFSLIGFPNLFSLFLISNFITRIDPYIFGSSEHPLVVLNLGNNNLEDLPVFLFRNLPLLRHLYLQNNKITTVPKEAFVKNSFLQNLDLSSNTIHTCHPLSLQGLTNLRTLKLSYNNLTDLSVEMFDSSFESRIWFYGNYWRCDCKMYDIQQRFKVNPELILGMTCFDPIDERGVDVMKVMFVKYCGDQPDVTMTLSTTDAAFSSDNDALFHDVIFFIFGVVIVARLIILLSGFGRSRRVFLWKSCAA
ncbi:Leucine-rich repeat-containing protein 15 [Holothuria leucospilota]|uniref:Leucine-rich repeat-containing protein 15 n=1 Tax=Holothuria leucospilota TaxID=206669 RepID=A0A9Q1BMB6_HOLLE|nr:Leucine-rich repeat-containing protein 15 [Holothuria leucospilota]